MARTISLEGEIFGGECPEPKCGEEMYLNSDGDLECPNCHLVIKPGDNLVVLPNRGLGNFAKSRGSVIPVSAIAPTMIGRISRDLRAPAY